jgi:hypothetical protein
MTTPIKLLRIVGVYHAEGSLRGELSYLIGKLMGTTSCALCDITHGGLGEKAAFKRCRSRFEVPIETLHLDEQDAALRKFTQGKTPCVVGVTEQGFAILLGAAALRRCGQSVERFEEALREATGTQSRQPGA